MHTLQHVAKTNFFIFHFNSSSSPMPNRKGMGRGYEKQTYLGRPKSCCSWEHDMSAGTPFIHQCITPAHLQIFLIIWNRYKGSNLSQMQAPSPNSLPTLTTLA